jgi:hypothetical protein
MRQHLVAQMGIQATPCQLIDGTPVHLRHLYLRHWRRFGKGHLLLPEAALGFCASKKETYYGFRLLALTTPDGIVVTWDLFAASTDERECAQDFLDQRRQALLEEDQALLLLTPKRKNQKEQNAPAWDALMNRTRRVIETTFAQVKGTFGLERPGARTVWGTLSRLIAKMTGLTLAAKCNREQGHSPLRLAEFSF